MDDVKAVEVEDIHADCDERIKALEDEIESLKEENDSMNEVLSEIKSLVR